MSRTTILTETARTPEVSPRPTLTVIKNGFGADVTGLDFANGVTDEAYHFIRDAVTKVELLIPEKSLKHLADTSSPVWLCYYPKDKTE